MPDLQGPRQPGASPSDIDAIVRRRLVLALDASNAGAWEWHFEHPSLRAAAFARLLGIADDEHVNVKDWLSAVHPEDAVAFEQSMHEAIANEGAWQVRHRVIAIDGVERWLDVRAEPLRINDEMVGMIGICIDVSVQVEQERREAMLILERQQASDEANALARRLQSGLLPSRVEHGNGPLRVQTVYHPVESQLMLGGDFLDMFWHDSGAVSFILGDVCGHGPEQAALGTILRSAWIGLVASDADDPARWATILNDVLRGRRDDDSTFVTMVAGSIDPFSNSIRYVLAGHPPPFLIMPSDDAGTRVSVSELPRASTLALGITDRVQAKTITLDLPGEFGMLAVTDGLYEGLSASGERLGYEGLRDLVHDFPASGARALEEFVDTVEELSGGRLADDTAALLISRGVTTSAS